MRIAVVQLPDIFSRFLRRPPSLVGVDIGSSAVKAVELTRSGNGAVVATVGVRPVPPESIVKGTIVDGGVVAEAVRELLDAAGMRGRNVALSLPGSAVVAREITLPRMRQAELAASIAWEAEQHIPFDLRDVNLGYQVVDRGTDVDGRPVMVVLLAAAKKTTVAEYSAAVAKAGCVPAVVDVGAFALQNAYEMNGGEPRGRLAALLDAGASTINVNIVRDGRSVFTRDMPIGGNAYTDALRLARALSFDAAERLKKSNEAGGDDLEEREPALREVTENLLLEVEKTFDFFAASQASGRLERIVLSGGASQARGLAAAMAQRFGVPVERFDPFRTMTVGGVDVADGEQADVAATAAVATGLALRRAGAR